MDILVLVCLARSKNLATIRASVHRGQIQASIVAGTTSCFVICNPHPYRNTDNTPHTGPLSATHTEKTKDQSGEKRISEKKKKKKKLFLSFTSQSGYESGSIGSVGRARTRRKPSSTWVACKLLWTYRGHGALFTCFPSILPQRVPHDTTQVTRFLRSLPGVFSSATSGYRILFSIHQIDKNPSAVPWNGTKASNELRGVWASGLACSHSANIQ